MSGNWFGHNFRFATWGESHGPAIGAMVDGVPPNIPLAEADIQHWLDQRRPGTSKYVTQRQEPDVVRILSGVFEGKTTGTPIALMIENVDQRSKDYSETKDLFRPGHADYTYWKKYGIRDYRGGGRSSARETAMRVAAGAVARKVIGGVTVRGALIQVGPHAVDRRRWDWDETARNPFFCPDSAAAAAWTLHAPPHRLSHDTSRRFSPTKDSARPNEAAVCPHARQSRPMARATDANSAIRTRRASVAWPLVAEPTPAATARGSSHSRAAAAPTDRMTPP